MIAVSKESAAGLAFNLSCAICLYSLFTASILILRLPWPFPTLGLLSLYTPVMSVLSLLLLIFAYYLGGIKGIQRHIAWLVLIAIILIPILTYRYWYLLFD